MKPIACALLLLLPYSRGLADKPSGDRQDEAPRYEFREIHDRNGIGKFYMGREIASVMGFLAYDWLERDTREKEERLSRLIRSLDLQPGQVVADIGAGSGVISMMMAEQLLPKGRVLAVDIQEEMLQRLRERCKAAGITNVDPVRGEEKSPNLKPQAVDLAIMVDVYHEFEFPYEMMLEISEAVKPGGRVALVEYRMEDFTVPIKLVHKMTEKQVKLEMQPPEFHLKWTETIGVLPWQHIVVFTKQDPADLSAPR